LLLAFLVVSAGCGRRRAQPPAPPPQHLPPATGQSETGLASWYGDPYHGRATANGEIYDMNAFTAAHRTLPFDTWVRVTSLENSLFTTVRINDRGPFIEGRIIDLSRSAAQAINMIGSGTALVRIEVVKRPEQTQGGPPVYSVQVGAFESEENAMRLQAQLVDDYGDVFIHQSEAGDGLFYRVRVGRLDSYAEAEELADGLRGHAGVTMAFVVRLD
jgi:rare lipoprotein A